VLKTEWGFVEVECKLWLEETGRGRRDYFCFCGVGGLRGEVRGVDDVVCNSKFCHGIFHRIPLRTA